MPLPDCRIASPAVESAARRRLCSAGGNSKQFESHVPHVLCSDTVTVLNVSLRCLVFVVVVVVACVCVYISKSCSKRNIFTLRGLTGVKG